MHSTHSSKRWWVGHHPFLHMRMTWPVKDIQMPSHVALSCPSLCGMLEAVGWCGVCMCELVVQSQLYMFRAHVVVGNLVGGTPPLLLCPCSSAQLTP